MAVSRTSRCRQESGSRSPHDVSTSYPSGPNSRSISSSFPPHGAAATVASSASGVFASSGRSFERPLIASRSVRAIATDSSDVEAYGRSLT